MNATARSHSNRTEQFSKYLKPGALAKLRDSKISARSHRITRRLKSLFSSSSSSWKAPLQVPSVQIGDAESLEQLAKFTSPIYGTQRFGRKKLLAAKSSVCILGFSVVASPVLDSSDSIIGAVNNELFVH